MHGTLDRISVVSRSRRRPHVALAVRAGYEALEERSLLSAFGDLGAAGMRGPRAAEMGAFSAGRQDGMFGGGSLGLGGGMSNPTLLLTAPLLDTASSGTTPPSRAVMSSSAVQTALQTLQTDYNNDVATGAQPTHASVGALQDTLDAIHKGTLTGTAAQTQIQTDQAAILSSMGLTSAQITQLQTDATALQNAMTSASSATTSGTASTATAASTSTSASGTASTVQTAMQTLRTDLQTDTPSGAQPTQASIGALKDDLDAIRKGTLTGSAAVSQVQTDAAAVLSSMGLTSAQITQIQTDQQAVQTAMQASSSSSATTTASSSSTSSTSSTPTIAETESTLQSVSAYLVGLPGVSSAGIRDMNAGGFGGGFGGGMGSGMGGGMGGGFGMGPRGGF